MDSHDTSNVVDEVGEVKTRTDQRFEVKLCTEPDGNVALHYSEDHGLLKAPPGIQQHKQATAKQQKTARSSRSVSCLGVLANFVLITPLVVIYWNTTWTIFDHILLSHSCRLSAWASAAIGFPIMAVATFLQDSLHTCSSRCHWLVMFAVSRAYTYIVSVAVVCQWRGIWMVGNCYFGRGLMSSSLSFLAAFLVLILPGCLVSVSGPPVSISMDVPHVDHYKIPTFWKTKRSVGPTSLSGRLLDTIITVLVLQVAVSTYWRALWAILDLYLLPKNLLLSAVCSVGIGVGVSCVLLLLHKPVRKLDRYLHSKHWHLLLICQAIVTLLYSIVTVPIWRGIWMLMNMYLPFRPHSLFIAHGISFVLLVACMASNTLLVRFIGKDGGREVIFDAGYVSTLVHAFRQKRDNPASADDNNDDGVTLESGIN